MQQQGQAAALPDSPFRSGEQPGAAAAAQPEGAEDSRGLEGRSPLCSAEAAAAPAAAPPSVAAAQPRRRELRSMSLRPALQGAEASEPSATASALEASPRLLPTHRILTKPLEASAMEVIPRVVSWGRFQEGYRYCDATICRFEGLSSNSELELKPPGGLRR